MAERRADAPVVLAPQLEIKRYTGIMDWLTTVDHKKIGLMYFWFVVIMGMIGGAMGGAIRIQLATPGAVWEAVNAAHISGKDVPYNWFSENRLLYNQFVTMHATI